MERSLDRNRERFDIGASLERPARSRSIHQNLAHRIGRGREKVLLVLEAIGPTAQLDISFVDERSGVSTGIAVIDGEPAAGHLAQPVVHLVE